MAGLFILFLVAAGLLVISISAATVYLMTHPRRLTYAVAIGRGWATSPAELGLEHDEEIFSFADGERTPVWKIKGKKEDGPVVIITHGWGDGRYGVLPWVEQFADFASSIVAYDLRGQGESSAAASRLGTTEVGDLLELVAHVSETNRLVVLVGLSMGAGISIAAAARNPDNIAGVIGESAYRRGMQPVAGYYHINRWPLWPFYHLVGLWLVLRYSSDRAFDRARHAAQLHCPLMLLHGAMDPISPMIAARQIVEAVAEGRGQLVEFENGAHLDLMKIEPERYREVVTIFFAGLNTAAEPKRRAI
ncbi:MAG: alpha/beta fold hydrolase [Phycisphaeraceae bacterium]|nr:alpha/beta fold hydrolase [Phycisphaeraceae bacterium]